VIFEVPQASLIEVFDINGKLLYQTRCNQGLCQWSTENLKPGMYVARIQVSDELSRSIKLIKG
jgi:hypothetical protein